MATLTLTQVQFDAIPTLAKQPASNGLVVKKLTSTGWVQLTYGPSADGNGNWPIQIDQILIFSDVILQHIQVGQAVINALLQALKSQNLSQADEATMVQTLQLTLLGLATGMVKGARTICNLTATDGTVFTVARKTFVLAQIDAAILTLL